MAEGIECVKCGQTFRCGTVAGDEKCWCMDYPVLENIKDIQSCYCPDCLKKVIEEEYKNPETKA